MNVRNRIFNSTGYCDPKLHYMVDLTSRLEQITMMVRRGDYFTINRARQYGKTTVLTALADYLKEDYNVISLDFQQLGAASFENERTFSQAFARIFLRTLRRNKYNYSESFQQMLKELDTSISTQKDTFVLIDFLAQLRFYYLKRMTIPTFQSVILAGLYDVKNIKRKIRPDEEHKVNSPWNTHVGNEENGSSLTFDDCPWDYREPVPYNIAADFLVDMNFSVQDIAGMLEEYESDHHTGMDIKRMAEMLYDYTSGYPFLVSRLCKLIDEQIAGSPEYPDRSSAWTKEGFLEAVKILLNEKNTLFESLTGKLTDYPELNTMLRSLLFAGKNIAHNPYVPSINNAAMFGFVKNHHGTVVIANRIFETWLYNLYLSAAEMQGLDLYKASLLDKNQFIVDGHLNMRLILERFVVHFHDLYGNNGEDFIEDEGRKYFLLYLRPIINGVGNYYIEAQTRSLGRTDVIVDYHGEQFVIEMKIWHGEEYNTRGEEQLAGYLEDYHIEKGYMVSFNFNKKKQIGVFERVMGNKTLIEAVV